MDKTIDLINDTEFDAATRFLSADMNLSNKYSKQIEVTLNQLTTEGKAIVLAVVESLAKNPEYGVDFTEDDVPPPNGLPSD